MCQRILYSVIDLWDNNWEYLIKVVTIIFVHIFQDNADQGPNIKRSVAIISIMAESENVNMVLFHSCEVKVIQEDRLVLPGTECWPDALLSLYGLLYVIQVGYSKSMNSSLNVDGEKLTLSSKIEL